MGSSRNSTGGDATRLAARSRRRRMPPEKSRTRRGPRCPRGPGARAARPRGVARSRGAGDRGGRSSRGSPARSSGRRPSRVWLVEADPPAYLAGLPRRRRSPATRAAACARRGQGGEDPDRRRLARAVVAEQAEHGARGHLEIEVAQRPLLAVALAQSFGLRSRGCRSARSSHRVLVRNWYVVPRP